MYVHRYGFICLGTVPTTMYTNVIYSINVQMFNACNNKHKILHVYVSYFWTFPHHINCGLIYLTVQTDINGEAQIEITGPMLVSVSKDGYNTIEVTVDTGFTTIPLSPIGKLYSDGFLVNLLILEIMDDKY